MNLTDETKNGVIVFSPEGRIDTRSSSAFEQGVMSRVDSAEGQVNVVMNFTKLDYINSTGMRVLLILAKRLSGVSGKLVLCEMKDHIVEVFKISGFNQILTIVGSEEDALGQF